MRKNRARVLLIIASFVFIFKSPVLNIPYHWDALGFTIPHALSIYKNNFNPFLSPYDAGHPPLFYFMLVLTWKILGIHPWSSRILLSFFVTMALYYTYLIGKESKINIPILPILVFFSPLFFAQSGILNLEIPVTAFILFSFYQYIKDNKPLLTLGLTLLLLTKITGILFFLSLLLSHFLINKGKLKKKDLIWILLPLFSLSLWLLIHKFEAGWIFYPPYLEFQRKFTLQGKEIFSLFLENMEELPANLSLALPFSIFPFLFWKNKLKEKFILPLSILLSLLIIFSPFSISFAIVVFLFFLLYGMKKSSSSFEYLFTLIFFLFTISFYSFFTSSLPRYLLPLYPFFFLLVLTSTEKRMKGKTIFLILVILLEIINWSGNRNIKGEGSGAKLETNLEYLHIVRSHLSAVQYIEKNFPKAKILTTWPQIIELTLPEGGYTKYSHQIIYVDNYKKDTDFDLIYYSPQSHEEEKLREIIQQEKLPLLWKKMVKGKEVFLYGRRKETK